MFKLFKSKPKEPEFNTLNGFVQRANERTEFTPDIHRLQQFRFQNLFIYGRGMRGHNSFDWMNEQGAIRLARAYTTKDFTVWKKKLGEESFPIAIDKKFALMDKCPIMGELVTVRPSLIIKLDKEFQNGLQFTRKRVEVCIPFKYVTRHVTSNITMKVEESTALIKAWMYEGNLDHWGDLLDAGYIFSPVSRYQPNNRDLKPYYYFSPMEYKNK